MLALARNKQGAAASAPIDYLECPADALREMRRALRPGGRAGISLWGPIGDCPPFAGLAVALARVAGADTGASCRDGPWGLTDGDEVADLVKRAGFSNVQIDRHQLPVVFEEGPRQLLKTLATTSAAASVAALDEPGQRALADAVDEVVAPLVHDGILRSELAAHVVTASNRS